MEEWRPIPGYAGAYEVSSAGRVRSVNRWVYQHNGMGTSYRRKMLGRVLAQYENVAGYRSVQLGMNNSKRVHVLVALAFIGDPPTTDHEVAHNDGNPSNNELSNLRYATAKENSDDKYIHGTIVKGDASNFASISPDTYAAVLQDMRDGVSYKQSSVMRGISKTSAWRIYKGLQRV